jgi:CPA1 family monovalent cation:H+ antiporter
LTAFDLAALFMTLVALAGWVNERTLRLPSAVAMLMAGLAGAVAITLTRYFRPDFAADIIAAVAGVDFAKAVLGYMLAFLLFAGATQVDLTELRLRWLTVSTLATVGVVASTAVVGVGLWLAAKGLGMSLPLPWALVFGALISPTDPIAVLATVKRGDLPKTLQVVLQGEALFNDGVGIVVFTAFSAFATGLSPNLWHALASVVIEAAGGLALGLISSLVVLRAMRSVDDFVVEVTLSVALAMGVYAGAQALHLSGPIAVVGAGLLMGGPHASLSISEHAQVHLKSFWTLVDEILNGLLFLLLGLQLLVVPLEIGLAGLCLAAVALVTLARFVIVLPWGVHLGQRGKVAGASVILAWGGLHGALSLALALSVPPGPARGVILAATFAVATFSIAVQGLTFPPVAAMLRRRSSANAKARGGECD